MTLLKQKASDPPPPTRPNLTRARTAELASFLRSTRGDKPGADTSSASGSSATENPAGYKHVQGRSSDSLLLHGAPLPLAAARAPSPHVGQVIVLEFDDAFSTDAGLDRPVRGAVQASPGTSSPSGSALEDLVPERPTATSSGPRNSILGDSGGAVRVPRTQAAGGAAGSGSGAEGGVERMHVTRPDRAGAQSKYRHITYKPATPARVDGNHGDSHGGAPASVSADFDWSDSATASFAADSAAADSGAVPPSKRSGPASPSVFAVVDSKKQSSAEAARAASRLRQNAAKPELQRPSVRGKGSSETVGDTFGVGFVLPAGPGGSARAGDGAPAGPGQTHYSNMHSSSDSDDADVARREPLWREGRSMRNFTPDAAERAEIARFEELMHEKPVLAQKFAGSEPETTGQPDAAAPTEAAAPEAPLKTRPSHSPAQSEEEVTLNQKAIDAAVAEFKLDAGAAVGATAVPASTPAVSSAEGAQAASAEEAAMRAAAAWPAAMPEEPPADEAQGTSGEGTSQSEGAEPIGESPQRQVDEPAAETAAGQRCAVSWLEQIKIDRERRAAAKAQGKGVSPASGSSSKQADSMPSSDEPDVWSMASAEASGAAVASSEVGRQPAAEERAASDAGKMHASATSASDTSAPAEQAAERSESGEIVFNSKGQPSVVSSSMRAKDRAQGSGGSGTAAAAAIDAVNKQPASVPPGGIQSSGASSATGQNVRSASTASVPGSRSRAPSHSFFSKSAAGASTGAGNEMKVAAAAKKAAQISVVGQQTSTKMQQAGQKKTYNFPHFDKFARRSSHVDMELVDEMKEALTPGGLLSSVASSAALTHCCCIFHLTLAQRLLNCSVVICMGALIQPWVLVLPFWGC